MKEDENMKRKIYAAELLAVIIIVASVLFIGKRPFRNLKSEEVVSAEVRLVPPDETFAIENTEELTSVLNELVIYGKDDSYSEYSGQVVLYTISLSNGKDISVNAYTPFAVIDGIGYKAKYETCEKLCELALKLQTQSNKKTGNETVIEKNVTDCMAETADTEE